MKFTAKAEIQGNGRLNIEALPGENAKRFSGDYCTRLPVHEIVTVSCI